MERTLKCMTCGYKFDMDIPETDIKSKSRFGDTILLIEDIDLDKASIDIRSLECPKCKSFGSIQAEYRKIDEKIIKVSESENFILSPLYPWAYQPNKTKFKNGYLFYVSHYLKTRDYKHILDLESKEEIDKYIDSYPKFNKKVFDKEKVIKRYLLDRSVSDKEFRNKLREFDGYKIEYLSNDKFLGVKYVHNGKVGKNVYGNILTALADKIGEQYEATLK